MKIANLQKKINKQRNKRVLRVRKPILESHTTLRLSVFRSGIHIYAQIIDDGKRKTLVSANDFSIKGKLTKSEKAKQVGEKLAKLAKEKKIKTVVFDRGWYKFHGRIKALAEAARESGLKF